MGTGCRKGPWPWCWHWFAAQCALAPAGKPAPRPPAAQGAFTDHLSAFDGTRWTIADGWANGSPFDNGWRADHVTFQDGILDLRLDDVQAIGQPYTSGEYRTTGYYGYGCYEASFRPVPRPGVGERVLHLRRPLRQWRQRTAQRDRRRVPRLRHARLQFNFWTNDDGYVARERETRRPRLRRLGGVPSVRVQVDVAWHRLVRGRHARLRGLRSRRQPDAESGRIAAQDHGERLARGRRPRRSGRARSPIRARRCTAPTTGCRYTAGEDCSIGPPRPPPPPTPGDATSVHVQQVAMGLDSPRHPGDRASGRRGRPRAPVPGAAVTGAWSGAITSGDTSRTTDSTGLATFYSSRSRTPGSRAVLRDRYLGGWPDLRLLGQPHDLRDDHQVIPSRGCGASRAAPDQQYPQLRGFGGLPYPPPIRTRNRS